MSVRRARHAIRRRASRAAQPHALFAAAEAAAQQVEPEPHAGPRTVYERLMRVSIRHTFYNGQHGECRDFSIRPTVYTAALLHRLGMLLKTEPDGFSVLYNARNPAALLSYLRGEVTARGAWTRLSFQLSLRNPYFVGLSELPIGTNPATENFYVTNARAHTWKDTVLLTPGARVTGAQRVPVTGNQLEEMVDESVVRVKVRALSGEVVLCKPRCVSVEAARRTPPDQLVCCDPEVLPRPPRPEPSPNDPPPCDEGGEEQVCSDILYFDLDTLPEGWYTVEKVGAHGPITPDQHYLYTGLYPMPLCFVDLLFSNPHGHGRGVYPVSLGTGEEGAGAGVTPVHYTLRFTRRSTWWSYFVVPQDPRTELYDLRVEQEEHPERRRNAPPVEFLGPYPVLLPGGTRAWRFVSSRRLPLEQRPTLRLRLTGRVKGMSHPETLVSPLPVASPQQVLPMPAREAWRRARDSLAPGVAGGELLRHLRTPPPDPRGRAGNPEVPPPECYSDIFVYV